MDATDRIILKKRGRPATGQDPVVTVRLSAEIIAGIDELASKAGVARSHAIRDILQKAIRSGRRAHGRAEYEQATVIVISPGPAAAEKPVPAVLGASLRSRS
jgi:hypothetical protein